MKMISKNGIVHLWDLPEHTAFIKLPSDIQRSMVEKALEFFKSENKLAKQLISNQTTINDFKNKTIEFELFKACKRLKAKNKKLTNKNIASELKRVESYTRRLTLNMLKQGKVRVIRERTNLGGCRGATKRESDLLK